MIQDEIMKLQTYKMFEGEDTVYVERDDVLEALKQQPCEDCISRQDVLDIINFEDKWLLDAKSHNANTDIAFSTIKSKLSKMPSVIPKGITVTDFAGKCRECGREKVLDKIKEEIRELATFDTVDVLVEVSKIIDKYKTEREVKDGRLDGRGASKD